MEFKAIIDAKAHSEAGCAVVGVHEDGDLGKAAHHIDKQIGGLIGRLREDGDFSGKLGDVLLLPAPAGAAAARVLLVGLGTRASFGRKQYRRALQDGEVRRLDALAGTPFARFDTPQNREIVEVLVKVAEEIGRPPAEVALKWVATQPGVTSTILGASRPDQLDSNLASLDVEIPAELRARPSVTLTPFTTPVE